ncbi:hypothetical protein [Paenibacillus xylanexedens]|uniref:hypothetical protein n=1 Tax=Paenibacillus sp. FSL R7-0272 TaxID=2921679 RepID=UPI001C9973C2|nr:hypothetical protein [Paenibacillus xylanexedens]
MKLLYSSLSFGENNVQIKEEHFKNTNDEVTILVKFVHSNEMEDYLNNLASEIESHYNIPGLKGSIAQIRWARQIRINFFNKASNKNIKSETLISLSKRTSAAWWINNKDLSLYQIIEKASQQQKSAEI